MRSPSPASVRWIIRIVPCTVLGMLVHNAYVKKALEEKGITTVEDSTKSRLELLDEISEGIVIFTAHGISDAVKRKAQEKGLICVDASCPDVVKTQNLVRSHIEQGKRRSSTSANATTRRRKRSAHWENRCISSPVHRIFPPV